MTTTNEESLEEDFEGLGVEVAPLRDVGIVLEDPGLVRPLQRILFLRSEAIEARKSFIRLQAKVEVQATDYEVLNKPFVVYFFTHF